jgi:ABC-type taurine transport system ATPase subunit
LLSQFHLLEVMDQPTQQIAYGKRRLLEMAIALACEPSVLLLVSRSRVCLRVNVKNFCVPWQPCLQM